MSINMLLSFQRRITPFIHLEVRKLCNTEVEWISFFSYFLQCCLYCIWKYVRRLLRLKLIKIIINLATTWRIKVSAIFVILVCFSTITSKYIMTFSKCPMPFEEQSANAIWAEIRQSQYECVVAAQHFVWSAL